MYGSHTDGSSSTVVGPVGMGTVPVGSSPLEGARGEGEGGIAMLCGGCGCTDGGLIGGGTLKVVSMATVETALVCVREGDGGGVSKLELGVGLGEGLGEGLGGGLEATTSGDREKKMLA